MNSSRVNCPRSYLTKLSCGSARFGFSTSTKSLSASAVRLIANTTPTDNRMMILTIESRPNFSIASAPTIAAMPNAGNKNRHGRNVQQNQPAYAATNNNPRRFAAGSERGVNNTKGAVIRRNGAAPTSTNEYLQTNVKNCPIACQLKVGACLS